MTKRPPNEHETKLHQAALASPNNTITAKQAEAIVPNPSTRQDALNFLLRVGLLKSLANQKGSISFRAVSKGELESTKTLSGEENLVLGHIKASGNEGLWTKHLKAKTNLHLTVIDRCLKTLLQKKLIKRVPSVQHPHRKIYMLEGLEPSIALTGGPWYTDNELDMEFIEMLVKACFKFIRDSSFPKTKGKTNSKVLYPISEQPRYPTALQVRNTIRQARLTETDLSVEHVEMLLNVLILDGDIEKIPDYGPSLWSSSLDDDGSGADEAQTRKKKRRRDPSDDEASDVPQKKRRGKSKAKESSDEESDSHKSPKRKRKKGKGREASDSDTDDRRSSRKRKRNRSPSPSIDSEEETPRKRKSKESKEQLDDTSNTSGFVYRALRNERLSLGWNESPCMKCPSFDFCKDGGPVNPVECVYYSDWLTAGSLTAMEDIEDG